MTNANVLPRKRWQETAVDTAVAAALAGAIDVPLPLARVLVGRGHADPEATKRFLDPRLSELSDPMLLAGVDVGARRLLAAVQAQEPVTVFGDYDADGITATAVLVSVLRCLGADAESFIPCRFQDGYGLTEGALSRCLEERNPRVLVTVDCGTNAVAPVAQAMARGIDVIVTDHHEPSETHAAPLALINPHLGAPPAAADLAGVGVVFKLCHGLVKLAMQEAPDRVGALDLRDWLDLVALGTVADVATLRGENRILVRHGLARAARTAWPGLAALKEVAGVRGPVDSYHVGFGLGPRLNAAGRLASATRALDLLLTTDPDEAAVIAGALDDANRERRKIEDAIIREATRQIDASFDPSRDYGVVAVGQGWHVGTIGIVASRLARQYGRPAVVVGLDESGHGRGSGRSVDGLNLVDVLHACRAHIETFGGHAMAAGLDLQADAVPGFRACFLECCEAQLRGRDLRPVVSVDAWVSLGEVDHQLMDAQERMRPFGEGNHRVRWGAREVRVVGQPRTVGKTGAHLKLTLSSGAASMDAIGFGMGDITIPEGPLDIVFELTRDAFRGRDRLQLRLQDLAPAGTA